MLILVLAAIEPNDCPDRTVQMTKRRIRELERELESRGVDVEAAEETSDRARLGRSVWFVAVDNKDRPTTRIGPASASTPILTVCT